MVVLRLGNLGEPVHEVDRRTEVAEPELAHERSVLLRPVVWKRHADKYAATTIAWFVSLSVPTQRVPSLLERSRKTRPTTEVVCEYVFRPLAHLVVLALLPLRVPPPAVVLGSTATGLAAAFEIGRGDLLVAALLLQLKTVLDNADGQLARVSGRVSVAGRYLDSESDLLVDAALFAAIGYRTDRPWLALAGFVALTFVLSLDYNLERLYRDERGTGFEPMPEADTAAGRMLRRIYAVVYWPHDLLIERFVARRLAGADGAARLAYHDRATLVALANMGLSTELFALGVLLAVGRPDLYCWLAVGLATAAVLLLVRREGLLREAGRDPTAGSRRS
jgi:archaetidylinositol phosphate synthase